MHHFLLISKLALVFIQSGQGTTLHDTGNYEWVNVPRAGSASPPGLKPCGVQLDKGVLTWGSDCGKLLSGQPVTEATFMAALDGETVRLFVKGRQQHHSFMKAKAGGEYRGLVAPPAWEYLVSTQDGSLCPDPLTGALAVPGGWSTSGELLVNDGYFTFACTPRLDHPGGEPMGGGVIAKCVDWGYPPWADEKVTFKTPVDNDQKKYDSKTARRFHQTCVRMAMADYCGEGRSNTVDDTPVVIGDVTDLTSSSVAKIEDSKVHLAKSLTQSVMSSLAASSLSSDNLKLPLARLEAVWGIDDCGRSRVLCLSKARWETLSLEATCVNQLAAERIALPSLVLSCAALGTCSLAASPAGSPLVGPLFLPVVSPVCDEWTLSDFDKRGATFVSYSSSWALPLVSFADSHMQGERLTTSSVAKRVGQSGPDDSAGYQVVGNALEGGRFSQPRYEGRVLSPSTPQSFRESHGLVPLYRCVNKKTGRYATGLLAPAGAPTVPTLAGLVRGEDLCEIGKTSDAADDHLYQVDRSRDSNGVEGFVFSTKPSGVDSALLSLWKPTAGAPLYITSTGHPRGYDKVMALGYVLTTSRLAYHSQPPPHPVLVATEQLVQLRQYAAARIALGAAQRAVGLTPHDRARLHLVDALLLADAKDEAGARRALADAVSLDRAAAFTVAAPPALQAMLEEARRRQPAASRSPPPSTGDALLREPPARALLAVVDALTRSSQPEGAGEVLRLAAQLPSPFAEDRAQLALRRGLLKAQASDEAGARRAFQEALEGDRAIRLPDNAPEAAVRTLEQLRAALPRR